MTVAEVACGAGAVFCIVQAVLSFRRNRETPAGSRGGNETRESE